MAQPPSGFLFIVQLHQLQAMLNLGLLPNPSTGEANPVDRNKARFELTLLEILQDKTRGNLTDEEEQILDDVIGSLRQAMDSILEQ